MENNINEISSRFRDLTARIYRQIWADFRHKATCLDRQRDENVFQKLQARYGKELEAQLTREREKCLEENKRNGALPTLNRELTRQVTQLVAGFKERVRSM